MARRKKNLTPEEELIELKQEAAECGDKIKQLTDRKKELKELIEKKQMEALHQAVIKSGRTIEEVIAWIDGDSKGEQQGGM